MTHDTPSILMDLTAQIERIGTELRQIRSLVGPFGVPFPDGTMLVQTLYGTKYFIDPTDMVMAPQLVVYRQWESDLSTFMVNSTTKHTVFVDVGEVPRELHARGLGQQRARPHVERTVQRRMDHAAHDHRVGGPGDAIDVIADG